MKKTPAPVDTSTAVRLNYADLEALREINALFEQRRTLEEHATQIPDRIAQAKVELATLEAKLVDAEFATLQVSDKRLRDAIKEREALEQQQVECSLRIRRLQTQLSAIEAKAPEIDEQIKLVIGVIRVEAIIASEAIQTELANEIRTKVGDLQLLYAKVRALQRLVPMAKTNDFLLDAYVPDLESCMRIHTGQGMETYNTAPNLLICSTPETQQAEAEIANILKPISDALVAARQYRPYIPLAKRPQPYVIKGSNEGPGGKPAAPAAKVKEQPAFNGYRTDQPYEIRGDQSGIRTRQAAAAELSMGDAIIRAADSTDH